MTQSSSQSLSIRLYGGFEITRGGEAVRLPQSKKTRALLAYLVLRGTPQRRDALCELFWDIPDDPRGSLRWSLSKLRPVVNDADTERLMADRERVGFERRGSSVDALHLEELAASGFQALTSAELLNLIDSSEGPLLAGLDLPNHAGWEAWRLGQLARARQLRVQMIDTLTGRPDISTEEHTRLLRLWVELEPEKAEAHVRLVEHLVASGQRGDAQAQVQVSRRTLLDAGVPEDMRLARALLGARTPPREPAPLEPPVQLRQQIRFCKSVDGQRIAYATAGHGPPIVKTANWLNRLEFDWESPVFRHLFRWLTRKNTLVRYDSRGNGLSDWDLKSLSLDALVNDLGAVVDAAGLERFPLLGISQGCAVAVAYAVRFPERVSKLILLGGYAVGWRIRGDSPWAGQADSALQFIRSGWGMENPAFRQIFTTLFIPGATAEQIEWFNELQRRTTSPDNAADLLSAVGQFDVSALLPKVTQPTLVLHANGDALTPIEAGRELAVGIPDATFVTLDSRNHLLLEDEPAWQRFVNETEAFLAD